MAATRRSHAARNAREDEGRAPAPAPAVDTRSRRRAKASGGAPRTGPHAPAKRPENLPRSLFHATWGTVVCLVVLAFHEPNHLVAWAAAAVTLALAFEALKRASETTRRWVMALFAKVAHAWEKEGVTSATFFTAGLAIMAASRSHLVCVTGAAVCAVGDPAAGFVGRRYGRTRLRAGRSLEGSLAFVVFGGAFALGMLTLAAHGGLPLPRPIAEALGMPPTNDATDVARLTLAERAVASVVGAVCGAVAEVVSTTVDDNLTIGPAAGYGAAAALAVLRRVMPR